MQSMRSVWAHQAQPTLNFGPFQEGGRMRLKIENIPVSSIKPRERPWRTHPPEQLALLRRSISRFDIVEPILIDSQHRVVCGSGIVQAAIAEGRETIPIIRAEHLTDDELRAYAVAANRLADLGGYDEDLLALELQEIASLLEEPDLSVLGFEPAELDRLLGHTQTAIEADADEVPALAPDRPIAAAGDLWQIGSHRLVCGDALSAASYDLLMGEEKAQLVLTDSPYNLPTRAFSGSGSIKHPNFVQGFGEMTGGQYTRFLTEAMRRSQAHMLDGALGLFFIDGKHMLEMLRAGSIVFGTPKNIITWVKSQGGMGSLWRSQTEFIVCFKNGTAPHQNNVMLGKYERNRTNAWFYDGLSTPSSERQELLKQHPTCKPIPLLSDAILDVTTQGSIVLDSFCGSGSLIIAAERVNRRAYTIEMDPLYVDVALRRARRTLEIDPVRTRDGARLSELGEV
jgi:hypothetical protein